MKSKPLDYGVSQSMEDYMAEKTKENWEAGVPYEQYVGRWSRNIANHFLAWLNVSPGQTWSDVGCGTGALVDTILARANPNTIAAIDRSDGFIAEARHRIDDPRVRFETGDAATLPWSSHSFDVTVSGLVLNFVSDYRAMVREMVRVTKSGGKVAAYVWDYACGMEMMWHFWDAVILVSPQDSSLTKPSAFRFANRSRYRSCFGTSDTRRFPVAPLRSPWPFAISPITGTRFSESKERHPLTSLLSMMKRANGSVRFYSRASHLPPMER